MLQLPGMSRPGTSNITVAVIDTGIDYNHPDLVNNLWHNTDGSVGWNFVANNNNPYDDNGHGTHVSGTIGAEGNNGVGVAGINWHVRIMALKFLDSAGNGTTSAAVQAIYWADNHGAKILNNSWAGGGYDSALASAISYTQQVGVIFVAAAGNDGTNNDVTPTYPANYAYNNVISVAATDANDNLASYSNYGKSTVTLAAPGSNILSTTPNDTYSYYSGTSMATPHVTGALALVWGEHPDWNYTQVMAAVLNTVDQNSNLAGKVETGGRLNLYKAVLYGTSATSGPVVTQSTFWGDGVGGITKVRVTFNTSINAASFTSNEVAMVDPYGNRLTITGITPIAGTNNLVFDISFATQTASGTYWLALGPSIQDGLGRYMDQNDNGITREWNGDRYVTSYTKVGISAAQSAGPRVTQSTFLGNTAGTINTVRVTFNTSINAATFTSNEVAMVDPYGNRLTITGITPIAGTNNLVFDISFATQTASGTYWLALGPSIQDGLGRYMDQNDNGITREWNGDRYAVAYANSPSGSYSSGLAISSVPAVAIASLSTTLNASTPTSNEFRPPMYTAGETTIPPVVVDFVSSTDTEKEAVNTTAKELRWLLDPSDFTSC